MFNSFYLLNIYIQYIYSQKKNTSFTYGLNKNEVFY